MNFKQTILALTILVTVFSACKKDKATEPEKVADFTQVSKYIKKYNNGVIEVTQLPIPDTTAANRRKWTLFSFDKMDFVDAAKVKTADWDFGFQAREVSVISANNGITSDEESPYHESPARVYLKSFFGKFEEATEVPAALNFDTDYDDYNVIGTAGENIKDYNQFPFYWAYYSLNVDKEPTHLIPYTNNYSIFKLTDGRYVKFQMINTYNNAPEKNNPKSSKGYLSFRYFISKAGSKDLKTK